MAHKFASNWKGRKPDVTSFKDSSAEKAALENLEELEAEWGELKKKSEQLKRDCACGVKGGSRLMRRGRVEGLGFVLCV